MIKEGIKADNPYLLVLSPTRELALQIEKEAKRFGEKAGLYTVCVYGGGQTKKEQLETISKGCHVLVATPGRLNDFIRNREVNLDNLGQFVIDEADRMLDM